MTVPSRNDLLKKMSYEEAWEKEREALLTCAGYMAYAAYASGTSLMEKLSLLLT